MRTVFSWTATLILCSTLLAASVQAQPVPGQCVPNDGRASWVGDFTGAGHAQVLFYFPGDDNWWLGTNDNGKLSWSLFGNTAGFGHGINDGRPFWIGDFTGAGHAQVLFYYPGDDNWWLGTNDNGKLSWSLFGNTAGFGHGINDGRPFWIGDFTGAGHAQVLFYYPGDDNWWLGTNDNGKLSWSLFGNTAGFGHGINDGRPFWIGDFTGAGHAQVLFYYPGDDNWWLGTNDNGKLSWSLFGNTAGFGHGINDGRPFWIGDFTGAGHAQVLFYFPGDDNWWLGTNDNGKLSWSLFGTTAGFGHGINDGRPFWIGDFTGAGHAQVLFYYPGDDNWWLGTNDNGKLSWSLFGNTAGFGHGINDGRPFWIGDFTGAGHAQVLFYYPGDDNWWLGTNDNGKLSWSLFGNTAGFGHGIIGCPFANEWYTYRYNNLRAGTQPYASDLSNPLVVSQPGRLRREWSFPKDGDCPGAQFCPVGAFKASPIVVNNTVFIGSTNGYFYALDAATGAFKWRYPKIGESPLLGLCGYGRYGIQSSATYANIGGQNAVIFGAPDPTELAEIGLALGDGALYALDFSGNLIWKSQPVALVTGCNSGNLSEHHERIAYSSPLLLGNRVYVGIYDAGDDPIQQGRVSVVDLPSGHLVPFSYLSTGTKLGDGTRGGGVWNSLATDGTGVYFTTGNTRIPPCHWPYTNCPPPIGPEPLPNHGLSMIWVNKDTGDVVWPFQPVDFNHDYDPDWAAGASIMSTSCGELIASVQKDGWSYAVNASDGKMRWQFPPTELGDAFLNNFDHGDTAYRQPGAAWNDVFVVRTAGEARTDSIENTGPGYGKLHALNGCATTEQDRVRWIADIPNNSGNENSLGAPTVTGGIVYIGTDLGHLLVLGDPSVIPAVGSRCSNFDYTNPSDCAKAGYSFKTKIPKVLADVPMPDGGDLANLRKEPALAGGRVFVATSPSPNHPDASHVYMLDATPPPPPPPPPPPQQCYACCDNIKSQCDDDCATSPRTGIGLCRDGCASQDSNCRAKCDREIECVR